MSIENVIYEYTEVNDENLKRHIINTAELHKYFAFNWGVLKSRQYCGIVNIEEKDYYLLPKISRKKEATNLNTFIYMLMHAYDIKLQNEDIATCQNKSHTILEVLIQLFAKKLFRELQQGIYKEYITQEENLTTLRGKYLINENLKYNMTKNRIYCEYDEFSMNNELNQFFLFTLKSLMPFAKDKRLLLVCEVALDEVEQKSFAFLFDMNELFEKFIAKVFTLIDPNTKLQNQKNFGNLQLKPDIITSNMIVDTKYKMVKTKEDLAASDKYQMFVYGTNFEIKKTMLLYPKHLEHFESMLRLGRDDKEIALKIKSIDLECDGGYDEFVREIKNRIGELI